MHFRNASNWNNNTKRRKRGRRRNTGNCNRRMREERGRNTGNWNRRMREEREEGEEEEILVIRKAVARNKCIIKKMLAAEITIHIEKRGEGGGE